MASGYNTEPAPKLTPVLDGKKVVFSREAEKPEAEKPAEQPKQASGKSPEKQ